MSDAETHTDETQLDYQRMWYVERTQRIEDKLDSLTREIGVFRSENDNTINTLRNEMNSKIDSLRNEMNSKIDTLRNEMNFKIDTLRSETIRRFDDFEKKFSGEIDTIKKLQYWILGIIGSAFVALLIRLIFM